jgi:2-amino-4-hydroxy-6-hydroxymethyldihydropteridine diphosphokinase
VAFAVLGLGGNLGSRRALLSCAAELLAAQPGIEILARSPLYETPPLGPPPQPNYLNAALKVAWPGSARALLQVTQHIEQLLLRQRTLRWGARTLDIDILYWSEGDVAEPGLTVPHPGLTQRLFALVPLLDVAPELTARFGTGIGPEARAFAPRQPFAAPGLIALARGPARFDVPLARGPARFDRADDRAESVPSDDPLELLAALPSLFACFAPAARLALSTLPFRVPSSARPLTLDELEIPLSLLAARVRAACAAGFQVRAGAITEVGQGALQGVFIGQHGPAGSPLPSLAHTLVRGPAGAKISVARS